MEEVGRGGLCRSLCYNVSGTVVFRVVNVGSVFVIVSKDDCVVMLTEVTLAL